MTRLETVSLFVAPLILTACASAPVEEHHYSLLLDALSTSSVVARADSDATLEVGSVTVPKYLQSNNLVMQVSDNEILPARRHFWAEPLDESIKRVLIHDLDHRLPGIGVHSTRSGSGCSLTVDFERFHATNDARVVASGRYTLRSADQVVDRLFDTSRVLPEGGYASSISELRNSLSELALEVVETINENLSCLAKENTNEVERPDAPD